MAIVLGLSMGHDGAAAIVRDGKLVCAIAKERINRKKHSGGVTKELVQYVLDHAGLKLEQIDAVACGGYDATPQDDPHWPVVYNGDGSRVTAPIMFPPDPGGSLTHVIDFDGLRKPFHTFSHHMSHCAAAYYTSNQVQSACFSVDASGPIHLTSLFSYGYGNKMFPLYIPGVQMGCVYGYFCEALGLGPQINKAGTLMGLAPYGTVRPVARERIDFYKKSIHEIRHMWQGDYDWSYHRAIWGELSGYAPHFRFNRDISDNRESMDIAASIQFVLEEVLIHWSTELYKHTKSYNGGNLCLGGGTFLNCDANSEIQDRAPFDRVFHFPACGDEGVEVGAAFLCAGHIFDDPRVFHSAADICYTGREYATPQIGVPLDLGAVAKVISEGGVVAWYQGRSEFGPRALGNRSILGDPRRADIKDYLNTRIKRREWFRPFAPVVLREKANEWFYFDRESPFMLHKAPVRRPKEIPGVTHVDGSARLQTVRREDNPRYYDLIVEFEKITGVPVLVNTSLNVNNEPLAERPEDAIRFFETTEAAALVINDRMILR
ncbi:MAG: hypothetical protein HQL38_00760 [Alphaproteobacteria bacterium]|nr:hypothetical protein [Alphaproteobacteria bacterium]MBF0372416.1 hypothetical protein [Alphaproteobacteria bacterium]MBF0391185.1 hypothetical protein [Alphaproteobacteria bacterium]